MKIAGASKPIKKKGKKTLHPRGGLGEDDNDQDEFPEGEAQKDNVPGSTNLASDGEEEGELVSELFESPTIESFLNAFNLKEYADAKFAPAQLTEILGTNHTFWPENLMRFLAHELEESESRSSQVEADLRTSGETIQRLKDSAQ